MQNTLPRCVINVLLMLAIGVVMFALDFFVPPLLILSYLVLTSNGAQLLACLK